jgi:hypothetical protein
VANSANSASAVGTPSGHQAPRRLNPRRHRASEGKTADHRPAMSDAPASACSFMGSPLTDTAADKVALDTCRMSLEDRENMRHGLRIGHSVGVPYYR